eukprot:3805677-Amphidinium_carterae.1
MKVLIETSGSNDEHDVEKLHQFLAAVMEEGHKPHAPWRSLAPPSSTWRSLLWSAAGNEAGEATVQDGVVANDGTQAKALWRLREGISDAMTTSGYVCSSDCSKQQHAVLRRCLDGVDADFSKSIASECD